MLNEYAAGWPASEPEAYFITFACYGARIHGDPRGSVDRLHNGFRGRLVAEDPHRYDIERALMPSANVRLDHTERTLVLAAIRSECRHESWTLHAAHVRSTHVHVVVTAEVRPETVMGKLKAYASRALNRASGRTVKRWARHGSTICLWKPAQVHDAVEYVFARQGEPMARYLNAQLWPQLGD